VTAPTALGDRRWRQYVALGNWAMIDQVLSSGTNFLLALLVVRSVPTADFGAFSVVVVVYILAIGGNRALTTEPLAIRFGRAPVPILERAPAYLGLALGVGSALGGSCLLAAAVSSGTLRTVLVVLGVTFPLLLIQDAGRVTFFAMGQPRRAAANDALWALIELPLVALVVAEPHPSTWHYVAAWLVPGAIAGLFALRQLRVLPSPGSARAWFADNRRLAVPLVWNYALTAAPPYLLFGLTAVVASLYELGLARLAYLPYGIFGLVFQSAWLVLVPAASRRSRRDIARLASWSSACLGAVALAWALVVTVGLPAGLGGELFGTGWSQTNAARSVFGVALVAQAIGVGPQVALRALEAPKSLVHVRFVTAPLVLGGGLVLAARMGAVGVALGVLVGDLSTTSLSWIVLRRVQRQTAAAHTPARHDGADGADGADGEASRIPRDVVIGPARHEAASC